MRLLLAALTTVSALLAYSIPATAQSIKQVEVVNFPDPQNVTGSVEVSNLPSVQDVNVTNEPLAVTASTPSRFQLVGFSTNPLTGDAGVLGMTLECQNDSPGSRMCTSTEVMETVAVPASLTGLAWVRPVHVPFVSTSSGSRAQDASGRTNLSGFLSCLGWSIFAAEGLIVDTDGSFSASSCSDVHSVACCAPVP